VADLQRLVEDPDASPLARSLLASAESDAPGARRRAAVAKRLGIAATLLGASGEVGAGGVVSAMWWKIGLVVVAIGGAITGGVALTREPARQPAAAAVIATAAPTAPAPGPAPIPGVTAPDAPAPAAPAPAEPAPVEPAAAVPAPAAPAPAAPAPAAPTRAHAERPASSPRAQPGAATISPAEPAASTVTSPAEPAPTPAGAPAVDARRLAAEVAILDRAGAALRRGDTAAAAAALDEHARDFADGALLAEAELLRIEALIHAGDAAQARARARDFLVRFPQSPLSKRLRSLLDRLSPADAPANSPADSPADDPVAKESP
jgi:hypothetical protein